MRDRNNKKEYFIEVGLYLLGYPYLLYYSYKQFFIAFGCNGLL